MGQNTSNIERLLEMLDNPASYSEQEIRDIINADDQTREAYRLMTLARDASQARREAELDVDVDQAWKAFEQRHLTALTRRLIPWYKIAAAVIGVLFVSGIAVAAVHGILQRKQVQEPATEVTAPLAIDTVAVTVATPAVAAPVNFDNVPLGEILDRMAAYYHVEVVFKDHDVSQLRFHYERDPEVDLASAIDGLNHFRRVNIEQAGNQLIVKRS